MSTSFTRRDFLSKTAMAAVASKLPINRHSRNVTESTLPARQTNLDDGWKFSKGDVQGAQAPDFHDEEWGEVGLPHDWSIEGPFSKDEPSGGTGAYLPTGIGWYRKRFALPLAEADRRISIQFDGVYQRSEVWINGHSLGMRPYGFITFVYDLTPYLHCGRQSNVLAVRVDNSLQPNVRWYSGSGIYRHVWLLNTSLVHFAQWGICIRTPQIAKDNATVEVSTRVCNERNEPSPCSLSTTILDHEGVTVKEVTLDGEVPAKGEFVFLQHLTVPNPTLWSVATPYLYAAQQTLRFGQHEVDVVKTQFGVRSFHFDTDKGLLLNGEQVKLNGVCLHADGGCVGAAVPEQVWHRRLSLLKEMGCNAVRCSHNPPASEFLDLCDTMGFLVMDEAFDEWREPKLETPVYGYHRYFDDWSARDLKDMIARDRNHPSIILWSAGNEVPDQDVPSGPETLRELLDILHAEDPTRPVTVACDQIAAEPHSALPEFLDQLDIVGYNYVDRWRDRREKFYSIDRHAFPRRLFVGTESVSLRGVRGAYKIGEKAPIFSARTADTSIEVEQLQKFVQTYDYVSGDFMWTGIDYLGESRWPAKAASRGVMDTCGFKKDSFYFYQSVWTLQHVLHIFPHWNWKGNEGKIVAVTCYTNCETVELFLNGQSYGAKGYAFPRPGLQDGGDKPQPAHSYSLQTTADLHLSWDVPYQPGTLKAVGTVDGKPQVIAEVSTTGEPDAIRLSADRNLIDISPRDLAHVQVEVVDANGQMVPTADNEITFVLKGPGRIIGVDNGDPESHESFKADHRKAFNGLALVLVQATGEAGPITLSASSTSLKSAGIQINSKKATT
ncbi:MAG: glycoside hydrolase family 2 TIM barrel-domain containing protein [Formivibrio sp.]|nr:glycoside hydrolase family 2 TIM barrel-domain containing protein [Formivibrio sp.]